MLLVRPSPLRPIISSSHFLVLLPRKKKGRYQYLFFCPVPIMLGKSAGQTRNRYISPPAIIFPRRQLIVLIIAFTSAKSGEIEMCCFCLDTRESYPCPFPPPPHSFFPPGLLFFDTPLQQEIFSSFPIPIRFGSHPTFASSFLRPCQELAKQFSLLVGSKKYARQKSVRK